MKKLLNDPDHVVEDMVEGICAAYPTRYRRVSPRALVRPTLDPHKVGIVIGGGSGHEPAFLGYVGSGLADGVALGNVFASPAPDPIVEAARAVHQGAGVLLIYGNYAGDCMNFEMAAEILANEGIETAQVIVRDDVASASRTQRDVRRGIAGEIFVYKIAGALAAQGYSLQQTAQFTQEAADHCYSMGVAWSPCTLPQTGQPSFEIGDAEMEVGLGVHGEPGIMRQSMVSAEAMVPLILDPLVAEMQQPLGRVAVLVNGLGSTSQMELHIFYGSLARALRQKGADIAQVLIGNYITSQEMGGCSVTLMELDGLREKALEYACQSLGWTQWGGS